ncbi:MAG: MFS transporter [Candidatus Hodarchaeota archaeon]
MKTSEILDFAIDEKKCKLNIFKSYILYFILGIHTVRAVYYAFSTEWGGLNFFEIMILQSYFMFMIFIFEIPSGAIADYLGRKKALSLSGISLVAAATFYGIYPHIFLFFIGETFWSFSIALSSGTLEAFLYSTLKLYGKENELSKILGRTQTLNLIALTLSAPLGSIIAATVSLQFTMNCLAIVYFGAFLITLTLKEPPYRNEKYSKNYLNILKEGFKELKRNKVLRILCFDRVIIGVLIYFLFWTYQPYLQAVNVPLLLFGFITSLMNITNAVFMNLIPKLFKSIKKKAMLLILIDLINGFAFILLGLTLNPILGIFIILIIVGFGYPRFLIYVKGINKQIESEDRATVLSTINMFGSLIMAIIYPFVGIIVMWNLFAVFIVIGAMILTLTLTTRVRSEYL